MSGSSNTGASEFERDLKDVPEWQRCDALPVKPESAPFGFFDHKSREHPAESLDELVEQASRSRDGIALVWTPETSHLVVPEELSALHSVLRERRRKFADRDFSDGLRMSAFFAVALAWSLFAAWNNGGRQLEALYTHQRSGLAALLLFIFGLLPLYEGWKAKRMLNKGESFEEEVPEARFDAWLGRRKIPATWFLCISLAAVCLCQLLVDGFGSNGVSVSIQRAGQLKSQAMQFPHVHDGEAWWRIFTAGVLHGNVVHFLMNALGLLYLGRRTEALARWPHLVIVFFAGILVGGIASAWLVPDQPAVGASGGLMGLLGFMLVFESLHRKLVPRPARRRLIAGLVLMGVIGVLGVSFIDNAAHAGGLLAGLIYAVIVFPKSATAERPRILGKDRVVGGVIGVFVLAVSAFACVQVLVP